MWTCVKRTFPTPYLWTTKEEWVWLAKGGWQTRVKWGVVRAAITDKPGFPKIERVWDRKGVGGGRVFSSDSSEKPLKDCNTRAPCIGLPSVWGQHSLGDHLDQELVKARKITGISSLPTIFLLGSLTPSKTFCLPAESAFTSFQSCPRPWHR